MPSPRYAAVALVLLLAGGRAHAAACAGPSSFTDIAGADVFCTNVEWMRNRGITVGCTATEYCPTSPVTRGAMALFMNRLAAVLAPVTVYTSAVVPGALDLASAAYVCQTADTPTGAYPRVAHAIALANYYLPSAGIDVRTRAVYSLDGGASWNSFPGGGLDGFGYASLYPGASPGNDVTTTVFTADVALPAGASVRFAVQAVRYSGSGTVYAACALRATIGNRDSATPPYDAASAADPGPKH